MVKGGGFFKNLLIWSYERGTLQYDIICALILAFIFFVPNSCFTAKKPASPVSQAIGQNQNPPITDTQSQGVRGR